VRKPAAGFGAGRLIFANDVEMPLICLTGQARLRRPGAQSTKWMARRSTMYIVAGVLFVLSGLFYAAGNQEIGSLGVEMCRYGSTFCNSPIYVLTGAALAAAWAAFVSVR
jgi:hypothetical protein